MNEIITNGQEIKQRIISEIQKADKNIFLAMAWFTDRDIANAIIDAKKRNVTVEIILSSNVDNERVKDMFKAADINVHAFETGDERGIMHHKFCLIDNNISINGSYNYSYNASKNNVENIHISTAQDTYKQLLAEFERLKYNIDHQIDVNINSANPMAQHISRIPVVKTVNVEDSFTQQLFDLVYSSAKITTDEYRKQGYENASESGGNIDIFHANYSTIQDKIQAYATDDSLTSTKNTITQHIYAAHERKKEELEAEKDMEIERVQRHNDLEVSQLNILIEEKMKEKEILESGNTNTGEKGLLQLNGEIESKKMERRNLESTFALKKFWSVGTVFSILGLLIFGYYLSVFFASAMFKVFFEGNIIRNSLEAGITPELPQLVDANAIITILNTKGILFGLMAALFFLVPLLLSNLKLLGSKKKWVNILCFWIGLIIFDILVATMVAVNTDEIKSLLNGRESNLQLWEVIKHGEFWLIFVFGMLPLLITHFLIEYISNAYRKSNREIVDSEKNRQIHLLDKDLLELENTKEVLLNKINLLGQAVSSKKEMLQQLEISLNETKDKIEGKFAEVLSRIKRIYDDFIAKITSGKIFTEEILKSVTTAYKTGFIEFLPELYSPKEVAKRTQLIDSLITVN